MVTQIGNKRLIISNQSTGLKIGLTGGIGSGKSYVLDCFKDMGFLTFDADKEVHKLFQSGNKGYLAISRLFPETVGANEIDRKKLSEIILKDPSALKSVGKIIHPMVRDAQKQLAKQNPNKTIIYEIPLLFENNLDENYDAIISTIAPLAIRASRALGRKGMTKAKFDAIVRTQVSDDERRQRADFIIDTGGNKEHTFNQIKSILNNE